MNVERLERQAAAGSVVAKTVLGTCYLDGIDVAVDHERALSLLTQAAELGAARAMVNLGRMHEFGLATQPDLERAAQWYRRGASSGEFLGWIYLARLQSRAGDRAEARESYRQALGLADRVIDCETELSEARNFLSGTTE